LPAGIDDVVALTDFLIEILDLCRRVLKVTIESHHKVTLREVKPSIESILLPEIPTEKDALHPFVPPTDFRDDLTAVVGTMVLDENYLIIGGKRHDCFLDPSDQFTQQSGCAIDRTDD
jgi:hypothetical protein